MADITTFQVGPNFNIDTFVDKLISCYLRKGYIATATGRGQSFTVSIQKNMGFVTRFVGLAQAIDVSITHSGQNSLTVSFSGAEWGGKICALGIGWMIFWVPFFCGIYGIFKQLQLPKEVQQEIHMLLMEFGGN